MRKVVVGLAGVVLVSCGVFGSADEEEQTPPPETGAGPAAPPEENATPPVDGVAIDGVFVSSTRGFEDGDGSPRAPLKTLAAGLALAKKVGKRAIVCAESYAEAVELLDGVSAYGYFDCTVSPWKKTDRRAKVASPKSPAVVARKLTLPSRIEGFEFVAPDAGTGPITDPRAASSIGLYVRDSKSLTLDNVLVHAGLGTDGTDGAEPTPNVQSGSINGMPGTAQVAQCTSMFCNLVERQSGGAGGTSTCAVGGNGGPGGQGGDGRWYNPNPVNPNGFSTSGRPGTASASTNAGGPLAGAGNAGNRGDDGSDGSNGAWTLDVDGFLPGDGTAGTNGLPGQGGGGGGGNENYICASGLPCSAGNGTGYWGAASGSGGGAGGCAGLAGTPGTGGGASIAALIVDSDVTFSNAKLEATRGGRGGKGSLGTDGLAGGTGGTPVDHAGRGGGGGRGGAGGLSGHGAPGPSIALAFRGKRPTTTATELAPGEAAAGQPELSKPVFGGTKTLPAATGVAKPEHSF